LCGVVVVEPDVAAELATLPPLLLLPLLLPLPLLPLLLPLLPLLPLPCFFEEIH